MEIDSRQLDRNYAKKSRSKSLSITANIRRNTGTGYVFQGIA